jgi:hypothetical protein
VSHDAIAEAVRAGAIRAWRLGSTWRSCEVRRGRVLKPAEPWRSEWTWREALGEVSVAGLTPPSSPASALAALIARRVPVRCVATLRYWGPRVVPGGWEAARWRGVLVGPIYLYDLRSAYAWAARTLGFPRPSTIQRVRDWTAPRGVWLVPPWPGDPRPYRDMARGVWTWEERDAWGVDAPPGDWYGLVWAPADECSLAGVLEAIAAEAPTLWDLGRRGFWGSWAAPRGPVEVTRTGHERALPNPWANPVWASLVTARVRLRMAKHWDRGADAVHVYVDALMTRHRLEEHGEVVGDAPGEWRHLATYDVVEIRAPGVWRGRDRAGRSLDVRRAGTPRTHWAPEGIHEGGGDHGEEVHHQQQQHEASSH